MNGVYPNTPFPLPTILVEPDQNGRARPKWSTKIFCAVLRKHMYMGLDLANYGLGTREKQMWDLVIVSSIVLYESNRG